jgi:hypothetical protein
MPLGLLALLLVAGGCDRSGYEPLLGGDPDVVELPGICNQETCVTLTFGGGTSRDTTLDGDDDPLTTADEKTYNYGKRVFMHTANDAAALLWFDLSEIPPASVVVQSSLDLWVTNNPSNGVFTMHQVLEDWTEGSGNNSSQTVEAANWYDRTEGVPWTTPGCGAPGSRSTDVLATFRLAEAPSAYRIPLPTTVIQGWVDGSVANYGFVIVGSVHDAATPAAREGGGTEAPVLTVTSYEP